MNVDKQQVPLNQVVRDHRLDLVKAISISLVLVWHLQPIKIVMRETSSYTASFILQQLYLNLTLFAVPLFILTSLFLLFQKLQTSGSEYLLKRCQRLLEVLAFWSVFQFLFSYGVSLFRPILVTAPFSWTFPDFKIQQLLVGTQPSLPLVGDSVFYFVLVLLELTIISYVLLVNRTSKFKTYISIAIATISAIYFEVLSLTGKSLLYWRLDNFLIYIPIAYFLVKQGAPIARKYIVALYLACFLFGVQDFFIAASDHQLGLYSRVSVVCGALAIFSTCLNLKSWQASEQVNFLSRFSLGIFAIHKYWQLIVTAAVLESFQRLGFSTTLPIGELQIDISIAVVALVTTSLTFASAYLLDCSPFQKFVR